MPDNKTDDAVAHFAGYVTQFHAYYQHRAEFEERLKLWCELLDKYSVPGGSAIDMGCGTGVFSFYLAENGGRVVGIDAAAEMVAFCDAQRRERGVENVRFIQGRLPAVDESGLTNADLLISSSVVEYVEDLDGTLALFARVLKPRAVLILSMPNVFSLSRNYERLKYRLTDQPEIYRYIRHFSSPRLLQQRVRRYGFQLEDAAHYTHYTRAAKLARWLHLPRVLTEDLFVAVFRRG
jgi:2-polyprenyl-3-methyl-5-hydroxy-6-metoxy-1,4-benzoquinol methylase